MIAVFDTNTIASAIFWHTSTARRCLAGLARRQFKLAVTPDMRIMPTGGIALADVASWLAAGAIAVGVGGDLTAPGDIAARVTEALQS